jgi:hypothetical protein
MRHLVATYSHFDELTPARIIPRAASPWSFQRAAVVASPPSAVDDVCCQNMMR